VLLAKTRNFALLALLQHVKFTSKWLYKKGYLSDRLFRELPSLTVAEIREFYPILPKEIQIEILLNGNTHESFGLELGGLVERILQPSALPRPQCSATESIHFPTGSEFVFREALTHPSIAQNSI